MAIKFTIEANASANESVNEPSILAEPEYNQANNLITIRHNAVATEARLASLTQKSYSEDEDIR
ncbi:hypothetical protein GCM10009411_01140 [Shewanella litoralis]|uniref:Uncharacterized protein n=1 Tax=Shewanella litoralis TaxID=2282700 RepID=A0ABQ2R1S5_9GAMM|nr:hypothetical protein GCM10009411_01140 [Shewanella litoralis]